MRSDTQVSALGHKCLISSKTTHPSHGSSKYRWKDHFPGYARLIPSKW